MLLCNFLDIGFIYFYIFINIYGVVEFCFLLSFRMIFWIWLLLLFRMFIIFVMVYKYLFYVLKCYKLFIVLMNRSLFSYFFVNGY